MKQAAIAQESGYTAVAFLVAPLVAAFSLALSGFAQGDGVVVSAALVLGWTFVLYFYALVATLVIGLPSFIALRKFGLVRWWSSTACGFFVGALVLIAIDPSAASSRPNDFAVWGGIGGLSAFVFWLVRFLGQRKSTPNV
jgi:hypothetical protein